jgi:putative transcriptional regulator
MYHYIESGLKNIWLINGFQQQTLDGEIYTSIDDMHGLHRLIGQTVVDRHSPLKHDEVRFLRAEVNMSQKSLSTLLGVDVQTVARWEKGQTDIPRTADVTLRALYLEFVNEASKIGALLRMLADNEIAEEREKMVFAENENVWQRAV